MSLPSELLPVGLLGTGAAGAVRYEIQRSLRFNSSDSAYLSRTPASAGNRTTWSYSLWVKRSGKLDQNMASLLTVPSGTTNDDYFQFGFRDDGTLAVAQYTQFALKTTQVFRDVSAWMHILLVADTGNATANNRLRIYVNGSEITAFGTRNNPTSSQNLGVNRAAQHQIGDQGGQQWFDGYLADIHFIDGQALDPTSFGEFDDNGIWQPIEYTGTYTTGTIYSTGWVQSISNPDRAFNGNTSDFASGSTGTAIQYNFPSTISSTASVRVRNWGMSGTYRLNYGLADQVNQSMSGGNQFDTLTALPSSGLKNIFFEVSPGFSVAVAGIEVNGSLLVDGSGINSFHLPFSDNSTAAALGTDTSPNGNDWTVNNITPSEYRVIDAPTLLNGAMIVRGVSGGSVSVTISGSGTKNYFTSSDGINWTWQSSATSATYTANYVAAGGAGTNTRIAVANGAFQYAMWNTNTNFDSTSNTTTDTTGLTFTTATANGSNGDSLVDVPTNGTETDTGVGGEVRGNYATLNPLDVFNSPTLANGNLDLSNSSANYGKTRSTIGFDVGTTTGFYAEVTVTGASTDNTSFGIIDNSVFTAAQGNAGAYLLGSRGSGGGNTWWTTSGTSVVSDTSVSHANGQVIGIAIKNGKVYFAINNTWVLSGDPTTESNPAFSGLTGTYFLYFNCYQSNALVLNAGARPFAYTAPSGYKALCTANLPAPVVTKPSEYMDVALWTGNNTSGRSITGLEFSPDLVWIKSRSNSGSHAWFDALRSTNMLASDSTGAESSFGTPPIGGYVSAFNTDGFTLTNGSVNNTYVNESSYTYAGWCWDAGDTTDPANEDGSITSSVRANPSAGFSICQFTCPASGGWTFGHGLNVAPQFVVMKSTGITSNWQTYHVGLSAISTGRKYIWLNSTNAEMGPSNNYWTSDPSSTIVSVGSGLNPGSAQAHIAYCFAPVDGYNTISSWTGNGSSDGPFIYTGHRTRFLLYKRSDVANDWYIMDTARDTYNVSGTRLFPNLSNAEFTYTSTDLIDVTANGFKIRSSNAAINANGGTYIFMALAEHPFQYARAR